MHNREYINKNDIILTFLIEIYFIASVLPEYIPNLNTTIIWYFGLAVALIAGIYAVYIRKKLLKAEMIFYITLIILHTLSILYNKNLRLTSPIQYFRYIFIAIALARTRLWDKLTKLILWVFMGYFFYCIIKGISPGDALRFASSNGISIHLIIFEVLYLMSRKQKETVDTFLTKILVILVSIWSGSRSGIIATIILLGTSIELIHKNIFKKNVISFLKRIPVLALILVAFIFRKGNTILYLLQIKRIQRTQIGELHVKDDIRFRIIKDFVGRISDSIMNAIFGPPLNEMDIIAEFEYNPHNSYINAYANFGIIFFLIIVTLIMVSLWKYLKKRDVFFFLLVCLLMRSFTDITAFVGMYDSLLLYFVFENIIFKMSKFPSGVNAYYIMGGRDDQTEY